MEQRKYNRFFESYGEVFRSRLETKGKERNEKKRRGELDYFSELIDKAYYYITVVANTIVNDIRH